MTTARPAMTDFGERRDTAVYNYSALTLRPTEFGEQYRHGVHMTPLGFVKIMTGPDYTALDFVWHRQCYRRWWNREWRPATIARLAREFTEDLAAGRYRGKRAPRA